MDLVHRDLKPSNIVIQKVPTTENSKNSDFKVKLVDFGLAVSIKSRQELMETCGTLIYQAPEQIFTNARQSQSLDIFACGFILYEMLTGQHPILLKGEDKHQYREKMKDFKGLKIPKSAGLPELARNLIESMCSLKPLARYRVEQVLIHPWVTGNLKDEIPMTNDYI